MRTFNDARAMAKSLRERLEKKSVSITHSESLELVAAQFGFANWNILAAKIAGDGTVSFGAPIPIVRIFAVDKARSSIRASSASRRIGSIVSATAFRSTRRSRVAASNCI